MRKVFGALPLNYRNMKKIAFHLNCLGQGGAERVVSNLANTFAEEGYEVFVATEWQEDNEYPLDGRVKRVHVGLLPEDEKKNRITKFFLRVRYLKKFLEDYRPDVLIAFAHRANYRALMASKGTGIPTVISVRINPVGNYDAFSDKVQIKWLFPRAAGCVFQTEEQRAFFKPYLQENSRIIINPLNPRFIGVKAPDVKEKSVVNHARIVDFKNHPMLLDAFFKVHEKHPDYVLRIYGPDSMDGTKEILDRKIAEHDASGYVFLMGSCNEIEKEIPKGEVYAYSSDYEGFPNSLLEAMSMGMPVVSTDCPPGGPAMIIRDGENGFLTPVGDADALADRICRLIEDKALRDRFSKEAVKVVEVAGPKVIYEQWRDYLNEIVSESKRA